jgi:hypothetical protein
MATQQQTDALRSNYKQIITELVNQHPTETYKRLVKMYPVEMQKFGTNYETVDSSKEYMKSFLLRKASAASDPLTFLKSL